MSSTSAPSSNRPSSIRARPPRPRSPKWFTAMCSKPWCASRPMLRSCLASRAPGASPPMAWPIPSRCAPACAFMTARPSMRRPSNSHSTAPARPIRPIRKSLCSARCARSKSSIRSRCAWCWRIARAACCKASRCPLSQCSLRHPPQPMRARPSAPARSGLRNGGAAIGWCSNVTTGIGGRVRGSNRWCSNSSAIRRPPTRP